METLRSIKCINSGCELDTRYANPATMGGGSFISKSRLAYTFKDAHGAVLFEGDDYGVSPMHADDSDAALLALLGFLTLRPGDTDSDYFAKYTPAQMAWARSSECQYLACDVAMAEEAGGCACDYVWTNLDGWECSEDIRGNVDKFEVIDHGEDGSQYFPGCGTGAWSHKETGVGDTAAEALEDALEMMAQREVPVRPSALQVNEMRESLTNPNKSAFESLDHSECDEDHSGDDWHHYVSIRYNVRGEVA